MAKTSTLKKGTSPKPAPKPKARKVSKNHLLVGVNTVDQDEYDEEFEAETKYKVGTQGAIDGMANPEYIEKIMMLANATKAAVDELSAAATTNMKSKKMKVICDRFTETVREFARAGLGEQIRRSFAETLDAGKSTETYEQKLDHAREVRDMLSRWNFGFEVNGTSAQLHGSDNGGSAGCYRLSTHGGKEAPARVAKWAVVKEVLLSSRLIDIKDLMRGNFTSGSDISR